LDLEVERTSSHLAKSFTYHKEPGTSHSSRSQFKCASERTGSSSVNALLSALQSHQTQEIGFITIRRVADVIRGHITQ